MLYCALRYVHSSFAIILMGKRELVALLSLSSWCLVIVVWLFLAVPSVCLQFVIVVFLGHSLYIQYDKGLVGTKVLASCTLKFMRSMMMKPGVYIVHLPIILERGPGSK